MTPEVWFSIRSYNVTGGHCSLSLIGRFIERQWQASAPPVSCLETTAHFRTERPPKKTLESLHRQFHANLASLPTARFALKKNKLELAYQSQLGLAEEVLPNRELSLELFSAGFLELVTVLGQLAPVLARKRGLNYQALAASLDAARLAAPGTREQLAQFAASDAEMRKLERDAMSPWDRLGIDWDEFHPEARAILDDPFFWSTTDDYSPNGNDTGADILLDLRSWLARHSGEHPLSFLRRLLSGWGMGGTAEKLLHGHVSEVGADEEIAAMTIDEAIVAVSFGLVKLRGVCPDDILAKASDAVERQLNPTYRARFGWALSPEAAEALGRVQSKLSQLRSLG